MKKNIGISKIIFIVFLACLFLGMGLSVIAVNLSSTSYYSQGKEITIHFYNNDKWDNPYIYYYIDHYEGASWPGKAMMQESENWYTYTIYDMSQIKVIFSNSGNNQNPGQGEEGYLVKHDVWYCNGNWFDSEPENTIVHYYNSENWSNVNIYYYQDGLNSQNWPGVEMQMESDNWYVYKMVGFDNPKVIFNHTGGNQIPAQNEEGFSVSGEMWYYNGTWYYKNPLSQGGGSDTSIKVHYYNYNDWNNISIYYYQDKVVTPQWPGSAMHSEGDGWFEYEISGVNNPKVIFNDSGNQQIPERNAEGFTVAKDVWYRNGVWYESRPMDIVVYFYKPADWGIPYIYYYENDSDTGPSWPGVMMSDMGNGWYKYTITKYSIAKVLFNDINHQIPAAGQSGYEVTGVMWYKEGEWYYYNPDTIDVNPVMGDLNGDGIIDRNDYNLLEGYLSGKIQMTDEQKKLADTNGDGIVDENDGEILEQFVNGEITEFPNNENFTDRNVSYEYDKLGRVTKVIYDSENYIEYVYDKNGNITDVKVTGKVN